MLTQIKGLHHVTSLASDAQDNNRFFTDLLGQRRVKKTVNFDAPEVYHLYYGDETGSAGTIMTYFPFPHIVPGRRGSGEVSETAFAVPEGSLAFWRDRLEGAGVRGIAPETRFGERRLRFAGPDGDGFALTEVARDPRAPFAGGPVPADRGIHGFRGVTMQLRDGAATVELLKLMGYEETGREGAITRLALRQGNGADIVDIEIRPDMPRAREGAGSVHHVAFAVEDRAAQAEVRQALLGAGAHVTPAIDRDYFWATYFRTPDGVLFEIATHEPGFTRDEDVAHLGEALKLPRQHAHLRDRLEQFLPEIADAA
ncbi:ring-cleaving dioxygenase [Roseovarius sp. SCSIO 43702]|uniref:ring-cleaving dioxygenase n=1 Tax=Roseovarius sp. SCSIO 43702 TaxID=2823043 RepID=UPI001C734CE0|nr:ring-cleaving dioxygenase [Roseovarius sp. SCSIO 43702]QYX57137.1 ring-cleaving dioxygenase [Roseovarius sp. SCSIO 43702]